MSQLLLVEYCDCSPGRREVSRVFLARNQFSSIIFYFFNIFRKYHIVACCLLNRVRGISLFMFLNDILNIMFQRGQSIKYHRAGKGGLGLSLTYFQIHVSYVSRLPGGEERD